MYELDDLKKLYDNKFKCIRYEKDANDDLVIYLKNFEEEKTKEIVVKDKNKAQNMIDFIKLN